MTETRSDHARARTPLKLHSMKSSSRVSAALPPVPESSSCWFRVCPRRNAMYHTENATAAPIKRAGTMLRAGRLVTGRVAGREDGRIERADRASGGRDVGSALDGTVQ